MSVPTTFFLHKRRGIYYVIYRRDGKQHWKSTRCAVMEKAIQFLKKFKADLDKESGPPTSVGAFTREFLSYAEGVYARGTTQIFKASLKRFEAFVGDTLLSSLTPRHADSFKCERAKQVSPCTVNIDLRSLRAAFNVARRWQLIERNPFSGIKMIRRPDEPPCFFTKEDFQKLVKIVKENWLKEIIIFAVLTGMRRGEILNLRWQDVDLTRRVIHIRSTATFQTKQGKRRTIPLGNVVSELLHSKYERTVSEYVFTLNGRKIMDRWVSHKFKEYVYQAQFSDSRLHFHSLRHTFASWLVQDGVSLYEVQKLLGHASIAVTQIYSHLQPEQLHETVNRLRISWN